ncbi:uncharacterized protein L3040_003851 [Drepanopeziza brunnea f. sp. 'multigermtubi']|uniref:uncharacterized protein n=1 Tax=Drepanopeziza brunnea f. sp. 'multigermtubi' TaxID=698441 RepID=UPI002389DDEB|nr:hypothetical protein L3040_003851 [Drepanopeziza brunnea f. sp. 'multigermtubi']
MVDISMTRRRWPIRASTTSLGTSEAESLPRATAGRGIRVYAIAYKLAWAVNHTDGGDGSEAQHVAESLRVRARRNATMCSKGRYAPIQRSDPLSNEKEESEHRAWILSTSVRIYNYVG